MLNFEGKTVVILGASGGLGSAIASEFAAQGASLALVTRREPHPGMLFPGRIVSTHQADITDAGSLIALRNEVLGIHSHIDVVVNAAGHDVRKPLAAHSPEDFQRTLDVNLLGPMLLTQAFLPAMETGVIVHLGGFADGRLAFPYYPADAASRAGLRAFIEAANRELALVRQPVVISFFSPSPANTEAERPFHPLWKQMGTPILPPEEVARELVASVARQEKVHIMGGLLTRSFAALNSISPGLADTMRMRHYGVLLSRYFSGKIPPETASIGPNPLWRFLGICLIIFSFIAYGVLIALPFLPISTAQKLWFSPLLIGIGEITFWVGGVLVGKEIFQRYKRYLNPCTWIR
jgi:NAD(P)-dependent dehydrogenase (short-subunit alcohol dehydrogenase family)